VSIVFVIINEWTDALGNTSSEVTGGEYYTTENDAWSALDIIAKEYDTILDIDETSLVFEDHAPHLQSEEYYIQELKHG
jgi:hypothetical protein